MKLMIDSRLAIDENVLWYKDRFGFSWGEGDDLGVTLTSIFS